MSKPGEVRYGDYVSWQMPGRKTLRYHGYVLGVLRYAAAIADVVLVADEKQFGMPVHVGHLTVVSTGHQIECYELRARYLMHHPGTLL